MKTYTVTTYFSWGSINLERDQLLTVLDSNIKDCLVVTCLNTQESITVKKAFQNYLELGAFVEK